ncbi:MAG: Fic family protein [Deltaproteobacteria bacterium]|nr:Fic family protein [Deltaproteobacteria bacterium]MBW2026624.1 Fic family protein [Deltaproteobacteria bacterium]MBW2126461.1 Fic family protein [Deltaproteobacteria bacterium]
MRLPYIPRRLPLDDIDWASHVPLIAQANAALARYDGILEAMVNPALLLSPLTTQEAVLSSRIEGTQATLEEVLEFEADPRRKIDPHKHADIQEIINYRSAMQHAVEKLDRRPLCLNLIRELHSILLDSVRGANKARGEFRRTQNWIGPPGCSLEEASFVPPSPEMLPEVLNNWEKYLHFDEKERLVQLALAKAQFELIHPFLDGNGRIGRMLVPLFLYEKKLLSKPMFYLSAYLERNREQYYQALNAISEKEDWNGWIRFFLMAVIDQAKENTRKARAILELYEEMKQKVPEITRSQYAIQAIDALFDRPLFQSADFIRRSRIPKHSAFRILDALKKAGIIRTLRAGKGRKAAILAFYRVLEITEDLR